MVLLDAITNADLSGETAGSIVSIVILLAPFVVAGIVFLIVFTSARSRRRKNQQDK